MTKLKLKKRNSWTEGRKESRRVGELRKKKIGAFSWNFNYRIHEIYFLYINKNISKNKSHKRKDNECRTKWGYVSCKVFSFLRKKTFSKKTNQMPQFRHLVCIIRNVLMFNASKFSFKWSNTKQ